MYVDYMWYVQTPYYICEAAIMRSQVLTVLKHIQNHNCDENKTNVILLHILHWKQL